MIGMSRTTIVYIYHLWLWYMVSIWSIINQQLLNLINNQGGFTLSKRMLIFAPFLLFSTANKLESLGRIRFFLFMVSDIFQILVIKYSLVEICLYFGKSCAYLLVFFEIAYMWDTSNYNQIIHVGDKSVY